MGETTVIHSHTDERGKVFKLHADLPKILERFDNLINWGTMGYEDYDLDVCGDYDGTPVKEEDRQEEVDKMKVLVAQLKEGVLFEEWFKRIPYKKNGTFHKARVVSIFRAYTFEHYWEDSYGYNGPELLIRTSDDLNATLVFEDRVRKQ